MSAMPSAPRKSVPLLQWIWRSHVRSALIPLGLASVAFLACYLISHDLSTDSVLRMLRAEAETEFGGLAEREATIVTERLQTVAASADLLRHRLRESLTEPCEPDPEEVARYASTPEGVFYTAVDNGNAAVFYSAITHIGEAERQKAYCSAEIDPLMRDIMAVQPIIDQIYFNTFDSMNRIYPFLDVVAQYATDLHIPSFNFYYEADAAHNPSRGAVWTEVYLDPAGRGWIASVIAPVYSGDFLEAVVGIDITVAGFINHVLGLSLPWKSYGMLIGRDGTILALPEAGEADWGIEALTTASYQGVVTENTFQSDDYNLYRRDELDGLRADMNTAPSGIGYFSLNGARKIGAWGTVGGTGWRLLLIADEGRVLAEVHALSRTLIRVGYAMAGVLLLFYVGMFWVQLRNARRMSERIAQPLTRLNEMVQGIGSGDYYQQAPTFSVLELQATGLELARMGRALGDTNQRLLDTQADLMVAKEASDAANRAKSEFLATMSHELRTPLNVVIGFSEMLQTEAYGPLGNALYREFAADIHASANELLGIISNILDLARIEAGRMVLVEDTVDLAALLRTEAIRARGGEEAAALTFEIALPGQPLLVRADESRLRQILRNLLSNAVKFTPGGGCIRIGAGIEGDGGVAFRIGDTGIGMRPEDIPMVLEPFRQVQSDSTRQYGGIGLGLAIVKRLVQMHDGTLRIDSAPGEGTTVTVRLPAARRMAIPLRCRPAAKACG